MQVQPITTDHPTCFGVVCHLHGRCARYAAVDRSPTSADTLATCTDGEGFPLFLELTPEAANDGRA
jgi:hypothetical protein